LPLQHTEGLDSSRTVAQNIAARTGVRIGLPAIEVSSRKTRASFKRHAQLAPLTASTLASRPKRAGFDRRTARLLRRRSFRYRDPWIGNMVAAGHRIISISCSHAAHCVVTRTAKGNIRDGSHASARLLQRCAWPVSQDVSSPPLQIFTARRPGADN
jgi:hypothetical protein